MNNTITALKWFSLIQAEQKKYKLVNGLFIIKYDNETESHFIGEFFKGKINKIKLDERTNLKYNSKKKIATTTLGIWKKLNISFNEQEISEVLK